MSRISRGEEERRTEGKQRPAAVRMMRREKNRRRMFLTYANAELVGEARTPMTMWEGKEGEEERMEEDIASVIEEKQR